MTPFTTLQGVMAPLPMINVDTDKIIPKQFLKTIERTGLAKGLFFEMRFNDDGSEKQDFVLNTPPYRDSKILVAGDNFGCGSSREHAAWALIDFGIRCVIAPSFSDIFFNNAPKNGMLLITLHPEQINTLVSLASDPARCEMKIDLEKQTVATSAGAEIGFDIEEFRKHCLVNGLDDIALTLSHADEIQGYEEKQRAAQQWLFPVP
ncbi:MAG: 3-isopropylmalate/(R)-2-methylmalate dehydratase small subunit [Parasphingorhabdus sp.]|jgi:3-isopropylmalate/(R)-2-methylmalate dehydratase small subunit